jgi:hypothetical protein
MCQDHQWCIIKEYPHVTTSSTARPAFSCLAIPDISGSTYGRQHPEVLASNVHHEEITLRRQSSKELVEHRAYDLTCGIASTPFLAAGYLQQLTEEEADKYACKAKVM